MQSRICKYLNLKANYDTSVWKKLRRQQETAASVTVRRRAPTLPEGYFGRGAAVGAAPPSLWIAHRHQRHVCIFRRDAEQRVDLVAKHSMQSGNAGAKTVRSRR